ncbi:MAG: cytosine permease [Proteobacteria bacterium]|nr:cytosine permease [Pseudomonadota bacterium]
MSETTTPSAPTARQAGASRLSWLFAAIETRSIDYIPAAERHGSLASQFTFWLSVNLHITAIITGSLAVILGGDVFWSLIGLLVGQLLGGAVMALHGAQGPQLGLPQMISSRVQFGVYGAIIPIVPVCLMYVGFTASGAVLAGQAVGQLLPVSDGAGIGIFCCLVLVVALFGYRVIHGVGRISSIVSIAAFAYLFFRLLANQNIAALLADRHFSLPHFLLVVSLSASWQIAFGPAVADYSRYLPRTTSPLRTFLAVGAGTVIGAQLPMAFGVFAAALARTRFEHHEVAYVVGLASSGSLAALLFFCIAFGKITVTSLNTYGSFMSLATIVGGLQRRRRITVLHRFLYVFAMVGASALLALAGRHSFLQSFQVFILFLLAVFTPWSAINLVDYYFFTRSRYDVPALADPDGRYGRWNKAGIMIYLIGILIQVPFLSTTLYTGPMVARLGGADISWILGLIVPGGLYYVVGRISHGPIPASLILPDDTGAAVDRGDLDDERSVNNCRVHCVIPAKHLEA